MTGRCPHCGSHINGIEAAGPSLHTVRPCGHFVDQTPLDQVLNGTSPYPAGRERTATVQERDGDPYITDGGTDTSETKYGDLVSDGPDGDERLIAEWTERPFTSIKRRSVTVEHRVVAEPHEDVGVDIRHEVRCEGYGPEDGWFPADIYEARPHGIDRLTADDRWWSS